MRLLKLQMNGLPNVQAPFLEVTFTNTQRVYQNEIGYEVDHLFNSIYLKKMMAVIGINASGKTTTLNAIAYTLNTFLSGKGLAYHRVFKRDIQFANYYYHEESETLFYHTGTIRNDAFQPRFIDESIYARSVTRKITQHNLYDVQTYTLLKTRQEVANDAVEGKHLDDKTSILKGYASFQNKFVIDKLVDEHTKLRSVFIENLGKLVHQKFVQYLDPSIEILELQDDIVGIHDANAIYTLKFYGKEPLTVKASELTQYLSSGTIKGVDLFIEAYYVIKDGGYLIIDELENHLNKTIVQLLMQLFVTTANAKGATLVFSTHYTELLDTIERNDLIIVTQKEEGHILLHSMDELYGRKDYKKSDVFLSGYLGNTQPEQEKMLDVLTVFYDMTE